MSTHSLILEASLGSLYAQTIDGRKTDSCKLRVGNPREPAGLMAGMVAIGLEYIANEEGGNVSHAATWREGVLFISFIYTK